LKKICELQGKQVERKKKWKRVRVLPGETIGRGCWPSTPRGKWLETNGGRQKRRKRAGFPKRSMTITDNDASSAMKARGRAGRKARRNIREVVQKDRRFRGEGLEGGKARDSNQDGKSETATSHSWRRNSGPLKMKKETKR